MLTIIIAHTTFAMAYVAVVVQSRLTDLDMSLEEAARISAPARCGCSSTSPCR